MFTIIGADQKQYGPVSADDIRQWIREGRADGRTLARAEGSTEWQPLASFPEFAEALANAPTAARPSAPPPFPTSAPGMGRAASPEELLLTDYDLDIFDCIRRGWNLVTQNAGPVIGITVLVMLAQLVLNQILGMISSPAVESMLENRTITPAGISLFLLTSLLAAPFQAVFMGGLYRYYLKLIRGQHPDIGDAFSGFTQAFVPLAIVGLLMNVLVFLGCVLCIIPGIYISVALLFAVPLMADKGLGWQEAMILSIKMVNKHWFVVLGMILVAGLVGVSGAIACGVGLLFTLPVSFAALMYAYEDIFGRQAR